MRWASEKPDQAGAADRQPAWLSTILDYVSTPYIEWNSDLELGIAPIDDEHKILVAIANDLYDTVIGGSEPRTIEGVIEKLLVYARTHFDHEERYFERFNFPSIEEHKRQHAAFAKTIKNFEEDVKTGRLSSSELVTFVAGWIRRHVSIEDRELVRAIHRTGEPPRA